jgi:acyl carrier protein
MGLDGVELIMAGEETFGIQIPDEDACAITTPGQFADCVMRFVNTGKAPCFSQSRFYLLRSALINTFGVPRERIRPHTPLRDFIKNDHTREDWLALRQTLRAEGLGLPELQHQYPRWLPFVHWGIPIAGAIPFIFLKIHLLGVFAVFLSLLILTSIVLYGPEGKHIPARFQTVASLIPCLGSIRKTDKQTVWTRESVLATIVFLTHEQLGVPIDDISEHSRFYDDLHMDS